MPGREGARRPARLRAAAPCVGARSRRAEDAAARLKARLETAQRKFDGGLIRRPELETARLTWLKAENKALSLRAAALEQHIRFVRACGG